MTERPPDADPDKEALERALDRFMAPLTSLLLERGFSGSEFERVARKHYVDQARKMPLPAGMDPRKSNYSLLATRTGFTRKKVKRIYEQDLHPTLHRAHPETRHTLQRGERVLAGWWNDPFFLEKGKPRVLEVSGEGRTFAELCRRHSGEPRTDTILRDLIRVGAVEALPDGRVRVTRKTYAVPGWTAEGVEAIGEQVGELLESHRRNLEANDPQDEVLIMRVANSRLRKNYAGMLSRHASTQLKVVADSLDGALNDPAVTVPPNSDLETEALSITVYITRNPRSRPSPEGPKNEPAAPPGGGVPDERSRDRERDTAS
jgi:hypothetical protein